MIVDRAELERLAYVIRFAWATDDYCRPITTPTGRFRVYRVHTVLPSAAYL